jgi:prolyl 4-hydroxylase
MYYIFLFLIAVVLIFVTVYYSKIMYIKNKIGLADESSPYIYPEIIDNFITNEQNRIIMEYAKPLFKPSEVGGPLNNIDTSIRNSYTAWIPKDNTVAKDIILKACNKYNLPFENVEDMQVVKYEKGNFYNEHHDSFPYYEPEFLLEGGHRVLTVLIYLNNDFEEGETRFINLQKNFKPVTNSAIVFHPLDAGNNCCHPKALHAGLPVKSGTKFIANIWIREDPFKYSINKLSYENIINSIIVYTCSIIYSITNINLY